MHPKPNIIFITYEEMKRDLPSVIRKLSAFLGKPVAAEADIEGLADFLSFDKMRSNPAMNKQDSVEVWAGGCHQAKQQSLGCNLTHRGVSKLTPRIHFETTLVSMYKKRGNGRQQFHWH